MNEISINISNNVNVMSKNDIHHKCKLSDKCNPNPCQNNGRCIRNRHDYQCDCIKTNFYGKHCELYKYKSSCAEYQQIGLRHESYCLLDSDGIGDLSPYTTVCNFDKNLRVYTSIHHNHMTEFDANDGDYEFHSYHFHKLKYEVDFNKIDSLKQRSSHCRQKVIFKCINAILFNAPHGPSNVGWSQEIVV